jgi:hypothetical protein
MKKERRDRNIAIHNWRKSQAFLEQKRKITDGATRSMTSLIAKISFTSLHA